MMKAREQPVKTEKVTVDGENRLGDGRPNK